MKCEDLNFILHSIYMTLVLNRIFWRYVDEVLQFFSHPRYLTGLPICAWGRMICCLKLSLHKHIKSPCHKCLLEGFVCTSAGRSWWDRKNGLCRSHNHSRWAGLAPEKLLNRKGWENDSTLTLGLLWIIFPSLISISSHLRASNRRWSTTTSIAESDVCDR